MATNVTITSNYIPDNINNSDTSTIVVSGGGGSDTAQEILTKLLTVDSDDSGLNANTLQGKTAADFATLDFVNTKLSKDGGSMNNTNRVTNLNADLLHGHSMVDSGNNWGGITYIGNDGVMEVGKYLDFHNSDTATNDYDNRLYSGELGKLYLNDSVIWHSGNDGHNSGLDSDSIDGYQASSIMASKRQLLNNENLDDLKEIGSYCNIIGNGSGNSNFPASYGIINVSGDGGPFGGIQSNYDASDGGVLSYRMNWGGWQPWRKVWTDKNSNLSTVDWNTQHLTTYGRTVINPTLANNSYTQYNINNVPYGIIGSDAVIHGGSATNMGIYVYGNNDLEISTNGGKRLIIKGDGNIVATGRVDVNGSITSTGLIKAYRYATATNLPAITLDKQGSYAYGIGPDGTSMRVRYGAASLDGSAWYTTANNGIEHYFDGKVTVTGDIQGDTTFISGFQGSGMRINKDANNKYNLELDNLIVRGGMSVYELTVNKVRATNGALYVSDSGKIKIVSDGGTYFAITLEDVNTFVAGDVIKCQIFTGSGVKSYIFKVEWTGSNANGDYVAFTKSTCWLQGGTGANVPAVGDTLVRIASDVANRQGNIYLTSSDTNSPYIQVIDGATSANLAGDIKVRLGKLDGITSTSFGSLSGYGLFTNNAVLDNARVSGNISATSGNIGGFNIASSSLSTNYIDLNNTTKSIDLYNTNSNVNSGIRFYYGEKNATPSYIARLNAYRHATDGDIFSIFVSNTLNVGANYVKMSGNLTVNGTTTTNNLSVIGTTTTKDLDVKSNTTMYGDLIVNGISSITRYTVDLTYNTVGAWSSFSSLTFNGRREGKVNNLNLTFYSSNSSASFQKLGTITNYVSAGYNVYFTPTTGTGLGENSVGYINTAGEIFIMPGKGGQTYYGQVTWITA